MAAPNFIFGFETGTLQTEYQSTVTGAATIESSVVRTGAYSLKVAPASGAAGNWDPAIGFAAGNFRFYARVTVLPASTRTFVGNTSAGQLNLRITSTGALELRDNTTVLGTSTLTLSNTDLWYHIEMEATGANATLYVDGSSEATGASTSLCGLRFGATDTVAATYTAYFDDIANYASDTGKTHPGRVVLLKPTSVNAAGGWVEGDGAGTAGMAAAVATTPPPGLASASETSATNIESPTNSATDNCDMNMTTYAAAGVGPYDTINGVRGFVRHGEDIATATKNGALFHVSNPADPGGEVTFVFGGDIGAHGSDAGGGAGWSTTFYSTIQTGAITLTTAPVLRVGKRTATTRVVCVDFMGIYVDFTPGMSPSRPKVAHYPQLLAH